jgi:hypothetical protein
MKYCIVSLHDENYRPLADITLYKNHKEYCERHGYDLKIKLETQVSEETGFNQVEFLIDLLPNYEWIWLVGCDTMVMNYTIKIEDKIDNNYSFIIGADVNGPNAHSYLVKNSEEGMNWLKFIISKKPEYMSHPWKDNKVIHDYYNQDPWVSSIKVHPQRYMNSYLYKRLYGYENEGEFEMGDWLLHLPGTTTENRMIVMEEYQHKVIK